MKYTVVHAGRGNAQRFGLGTVMLNEVIEIEPGRRDYAVGKPDDLLFGGDAQQTLRCLAGATGDVLEPS